VVTVTVGVSSLLVARGVVIALVLLGFGGALTAARLHRLPVWRLGVRRLVLEAQAEMLEEGPRLALVHLRLQLDEALTLIEPPGWPGMELGDVGRWARRLHDNGGRAAVQLDSLLRAKTDSASVVRVARTLVGEIDELADRLARAAIGTAAGVPDVDLAELRAGIEERLTAVETRTQTLRDMTGGG
jgi:hypothetical protein